MATRSPLRHPRGVQPVAALRKHRSVCERRAAAGSGRGERRGMREAAALSAFGTALGHGGYVRAGAAGQRKSAEAATPSTPRAFAATRSSFIRPITISCARASPRACMPRPGRPPDDARAPPAEVARAARVLHGGAGRDRASVPDHHDARRAGARSPPSRRCRAKSSPQGRHRAATTRYSGHGGKSRA